MIDKNYNPNSKPGTPAAMVPSKTVIINWLKSIFPDLPLALKIQDFGNGVLYSRILNHYYPATIPQSKIINHPKTQYEFSTNLKYVQQALVQLNVKINFDVNKVAKRKFLQNWALINSLYKQFTSEQSQVPENPFNRVGKRTYQAAFPEANQINRPQPLQQSNFGYMLPPWDRTAFPPSMNSNFATQQPKPNNFFKENTASLIQNHQQNNSPMKGKWSVNAQMFQNNQSAVIDRIKEILFKSSTDTEKIRQIKMLLNIPIEEEDIVKIEEDDDAINHVVYNKEITLNNNEKKTETRSENDVNPDQKQSKERVSSANKAKKPFKV